MEEKAGLLDVIRYAKYLPEIMKVLALFQELGKVPDDWTDADKVTTWLHEAEDELVVVITAIAEIVKEAQADSGDEDDPLVVGRVRRSLGG